MCSDGWVRHGKSSFLILDVPSLEWNDARRTCRNLGGDLPKITSSAENQFVTDLLIRKQTTKVTEFGVWLGLRRRAAGSFYWIDNTPLSGYTAWARNEPTGPAEECVLLYGLYEEGKWNDIRCDISGSDIKRAPIVLCQKESE